MDVNDVITLIEYIKDNNDEIYTELDKRFRRINEQLEEIFKTIWEIENQNKKTSIETSIDEYEDLPF